MVTIAQSLPQSSGPLTWVREFLKQELAPYPGRAAIVARMTIAATLVMIVCMTFRVPYAFQGAIYVLMISRQTSRATVESAATILLVTAIGAAYLLVSMWFLIDLPLLHFLWVIGSFFLVFLCGQHSDELHRGGGLRHHDCRWSSILGPPCLSRD